jgi:superfamily II DNA or RNA helicase
MVTMATGGGKTLVGLALLDEVLRPHQRSLWLAHRQELITQPYERLADFFPHRVPRTGIVMAERNDAHAQIVIATVQTLGSEKRLGQLLANGTIDYLLYDECHHVVSDSSLVIIAALKATNPALRHLGVTATPLRADRQGMRKVYQKESAHFGIKELVKMGYLAPPRWLAIQTGISLAGVRSSGSGDDRDFNQGQLASVFETSNCFDLVVESHKRYAADRPSIAFTTSVVGAHNLAKTFRNAGISAAAADGTTGREARKQLLADFRCGNVQVLCNVALWTEGLDLPELSCVHQVRPTQSDGLYAQMIGRALRLSPGKDTALILDYAPKETRNIAMLGDVLGVDAEKSAYVKEQAEEGEIIAGLTFDGATHWLEGNPMAIVSRALDYLHETPWRWLQPHGKHGAMVLGLGKADDGVDRSLVLTPPGEVVKAFLVAKREEERWHKAWEVKSGSFEEVSEWAAIYAEQRGTPVLARKKSPWQRNEPSDGQVKYAMNLGVYRAGMTRGECADAITAKLALNAVKRLGVNL